MKMALPLESRTALVTGAANGIGKGIALELARRGCDVAVNDYRDGEGAQRTAAEIAALGRTAFPVLADVGNAAEVRRMFEDVLGHFPRLDILVNNAGCQVFKPLLELEEAEWDRVIDTNLKGCFLCTQQAARHMKQAGGGRIVNIGSTSGFMGRSRAVAYSAAKGGVANLTRAMAAQLAPHKIRVNAIVPNKIGSPVGRDEFDPSRPVPNMAKRPGQPAEAAKAVLFLVTDDSSFVWGANLFVDGGVSAMDLS